MSTRLAAAVILVSLVSLVVATWVGLTTGRDLGEDLYTERLDALQTSAAFDTTAAVVTLERSTTAAADSPQAGLSIEAFSDAFDELADELGSDRTLYADEIAELIEPYELRYIEPQIGTGREPALRDLLAETPAAIRLQSSYSVPDRDAVPEAIDDAADGTSWTEVHRIVHPVYRDIVERVGLVDLFLIDADGTVVYSVKKNPDLGTNLETGPFSGTGLALSVDRVLKNPDEGTFTSDLSFYPTALVPVGVSASPVYDTDGAVVGVLAAMYDSTPLTAILSAEGEWEDAGYPETSSTYLGGLDGTTRSEPRGFVEDPVLFLDEAMAAGQLTEEERLAIESRGTTVLTLRADDSTILAARDGETEISERQSIVGADVFSTVTPLGDGTPPWLVVAEIETSTANSDIDDFREVLIVGVAIFVAILAFAAVYWSSGIVRPIRQISDRLAHARIRQGDGAADSQPEPLDVPDRSPIEFHRLANSFESMAASLRAQRTGVAAARDDRLTLLRKMLPPSVAQRIADGHVQALEEVPQVTVCVAVVEGMGSLVQVGAESASRDIVDRLLEELDELADRHGIERVKVVGDAYFAACGHDRPYLDHAPRVVSFATDARDAVREIATETGMTVGLDLAAGIHTGPVTVGMTGGTRLVYDVWGDTVTLAHEIARRAGHGKLLVTDDTRSLLPESIAVDRDAGAGLEGLDVWAIEPATVGGSA